MNTLFDNIRSAQSAIELIGYREDAELLATDKRDRALMLIARRLESLSKKPAPQKTTPKRRMVHLFGYKSGATAY